jgi:GAF domain-containing protein
MASLGKEVSPHLLAMSPVLDAVLDAAIQATGANAGWLVVDDRGRQRVVAAAGADASTLLGASTEGAEGVSGFVLQSGQPIALSSPSDPRMHTGWTARRNRSLNSVLCVPCASADMVHGALELVDKGGGGPFTISDLETATLLAGIAGAALSTDLSLVPTLTPSEVEGELARLLELDPRRYRAVVSLLNGLMANA